MGTPTKSISNFKFLVATLVEQQRPDLMLDITESFVKDFHKSPSNDFSVFVGENIITGNKLEVFLRERKAYDYFENQAKLAMTNPKIAAMVGRDLLISGVKASPTRNVKDYNALLLEKAIELTVKPSTRVLCKLKNSSFTKFSKAMREALLHSLGFKEMSSGTWIGIARGLDSALKNPKGGKLGATIGDGGTMQMAIALAKPVEVIAKKYALPVATPVKKALVRFKNNAFAAAAFTMFLFNAPMDDLPKNVIDYAANNVENTFVLSNTGYAGDRDIEGEFLMSDAHIDAYSDAKVDSEVFGEIIKSNKYTTPTDAPLPYMEESEELSFSESMALAVGSVESTHQSYVIVKDGDNLWSIAAEQVDRLNNKFDIFLDGTGNPSRVNELINEVHKQIKADFDLPDPNLIFKGQKIKVPSDHAALISLINVLETAENPLKPGLKTKP